MIDQLALGNADHNKVAEAAMSTLNVLQSYDSHIQALAAAAVFVVVSEKHKHEAQDIMVAIKNMLKHEFAGETPEWRAFKAYIENEI